MTSQEGFPTPLEIKVLAEDYGFVERRAETSFTLFFRETHPSDPECPTLINIFYTTRGIMTKTKHPERGYNELWRTSAYDSLTSLAMLFEDPRMHTGRGYRNVKNKPMTRGCVKCGYSKVRSEFTDDMWKAGPSESICRQCCAEGGDNNEAAGASENGIKKKSANKGNNMNGRKNTTTNTNNNTNHIAPTVLSEDALREHDRSSNNTTGGGNGGGNRGGVERREFNCPICPTKGRGKHVFFKNVPADKPIVKCPKCKKVKSGDCERLYPIPKGEEKGYGHFRCTKCKSTWGSSRAIGNIGQQCAVCLLAGNPGRYVKPFRMEVYKSGKGGGIVGGGARPAGRGGARRKPREPIREDEEEGRSYTPLDRARFQNRSGDAPAGGQSFEWVQDRTSDTVSQASSSAASRLSAYKAATTHQCEGCVTGICRSRKLPISGVHDVHDGDTASTSGSFATNSEIDKAEFEDRDIDFCDWDEEDDEVWVTMGKNGKMLRG